MTSRRDRAPSDHASVAGGAATATTRVALTTLVVALAIALRLAGIRQGLPSFDEEAAPFRWALQMWAHRGGHIDWDPPRFIYPTLTLYLHLLLQQLHLLFGQAVGLFGPAADYHLAVRVDPTPMVLLARLLGIAADAISVILVARIGERMRPGAGLLAALLMACSPILIGTSRMIYTDPIMLVFSLAALDRMLTHRAESSWRGVLPMAVFAGLAIGSKYTAAVLVLPLAFTLSHVHGVRGALQRLPVMLASMLATFLATSPYVLVDRERFWRDVRFDQTLAREGLLGATSGPSGFATLTTLATDLGLAVTILAVAGLTLAITRERRSRTWPTLALFAVAFVAPVLASPLRFERYLVPVIPAAALLAALALFAAAERLPTARRRLGIALAVLVCAVPAVFAGGRASASAETSSQAEAKAWCVDHISVDNIVVTESYGPELRSHRDATSEDASELSRSASATMQERARARRWWRSVRLPGLVAGHCNVVLVSRDGARREAMVFQHASDFASVVYDPRLLAGADFVITSSAVRGRFEADPVRYARPCAFYARLDSVALVVARFPSRAGVSGPAITVYALDAAARARIAGTPLGPWWWTEHIPEEYRRTATQFLAPGTNAAAPDADTTAFAWRLGLASLYREQLQPLSEELAWNLIDVDRSALAGQLMAATLRIQPASAWACLLGVEAAQLTGDWPGVLDAYDRHAAVVDPRSIDPAVAAIARQARTHLSQSRPRRH